jgi:hypothetical protein
MLVKQISVFVENKQGRLVDIIEELAKQDINIGAVSIADTTDFGILRMIVNKPDAAYAGLKEAGYTVSMTEVIAVEMEDIPGGLYDVLKVLQKCKISIEYLYSFVRRTDTKAIIICRVEDPQAAIEALQGDGKRVLTQDEVYHM